MSDGSGEDDLTGHETHPSMGDVSLRDVTDGDLPIFFEHQLDPEANRMAASQRAAPDRGAASFAMFLPLPGPSSQ